jgi:Na+/H+-translocating membrane pyrophosphatase
MTATTADPSATGAETPDTFFAAKTAPAFIIGSAVFAIFWGVVNALLVRNIDMSDHSAVEATLKGDGQGSESVPLTGGEQPGTAAEIMAQMDFIGGKITEGAISFLAREYLYLGVFSGVFAVVLGLTVDWQEMSLDEQPTNFPYTAAAYLIGSGTSIIAGYIGMRIAVFTNTRTCFQCCRDVHDGFLAAFRGGQVLGFVLVGLALLVLELIIIIFRSSFYSDAIAAVIAGQQTDGLTQEVHNQQVKLLTRRLFELIAGYGLGGSSVALFGRVGGGIYTKAADVGADLVGKTLKDLKEDDASNPDTIADNVGDNVGDIAGMGADLFGSLAESTCAALVVSSTSIELISKEDALYFPLMVTASGILASFVSVLFVHLSTVTVDNVQAVLKYQIALSTIFMTFAVIPSVMVLPEDGFTFDNNDYLGGITPNSTNWIEPLVVSRW